MKALSGITTVAAAGLFATLMVSNCMLSEERDKTEALEFKVQKLKADLDSCEKRRFKNIETVVSRDMLVSQRDGAVHDAEKWKELFEGCVAQKLEVHR